MNRSELMKRVRQKDTAPELKLRSALWRLGYRYRLGRKIHGVRPDLVFPRAKVAVFVDGCFWHGCPNHYVMPRNSPEYWGPKLRANVQRDQRQTRQLEECGWRVLRFWEHEVREELDCVIDEIARSIRGERPGTREHWVVYEINDCVVAGDSVRRFLCELRNSSPPRTEVTRR